MAEVIAEPYIAVTDKACVEVGPVDCSDEGPNPRFIHPDEGIDCGPASGSARRQRSSPRTKSRSRRHPRGKPLHDEELITGNLGKAVEATNGRRPTGRLRRRHR